MSENLSAPVIEGKNLSKTFYDFWGKPKVKALRSIDISVKTDTIFGLLGPNGAGKSTLIKLILGHLYPTSGYITVLGKSPRDVESKQRIGYLPERISFYANLTARETLVFFGQLLGLPASEIKRRITQLLQMVGLENAADRFVGEFSHGMQKRLGLAQSLLNDPDLLLFDEPTAGLDPIGCREVKDLILTLRKRGKTILMTSHLLGDIQDVCDTIMILYSGQVQASGSVNELLAKKDEILIRTSVVSEETLKKAKDVLRTENKNGVLKVSSAMRTLEDYFLSVVTEASRGGTETSGAAIGTGVADYLTDGLDNETLKTLTKKSPETSAPPEKTELKVDFSEIKRLGAKKKDEQEIEETEKPDLEALSSLTKNRKENIDNKNR